MRLGIASCDAASYAFRSHRKPRARENEKARRVACRNPKRGERIILNPSQTQVSGCKEMKTKLHPRSNISEREERQQRLKGRRPAP